MVLPPAKDGKVVEHGISGFPLYFSKKGRPTVITNDIWAYLEYASLKQLPKEAAQQAIAYVDQAFEFYEAASNPRFSSRPMLYYYSFLNLAKVLLLHRRMKFPPLLDHGLSDPKTNVKGGLSLAAQRVSVKKRSTKHDRVFAEFVVALKGNPTKFLGSYRTLDLMQQMPGIHRTYCAVTGSEPRFCPIEHLEIIKDQDRYWVRMRLEKHDPDVKATRVRASRRQGFRQAFDGVAPRYVRSDGTEDKEKTAAAKEREVWYETDTQTGPKRAVDTALRSLRDLMRQVGIWTILTSRGPRYYLGNFTPSVVLPQLASVYALMFYLGSITRYKPYAFDRIATKRYGWLISEFLETQPAQFTYSIASQIAGADVVVPYALAPIG